jgi:hypothetical protein
MKCNAQLIWVFWLFIFSSIYAQPLHIAGKQSGTFESGEYCVDEDINVPPEKKLILPPGTRLYFNPHTVLKVFGELECEGTEENPIVFRIISDTTGSQSDDFLQWTGIIVTKQGRISFEYCEIANSLYGVQAPDTLSLIKFKSISFYNNDNQLTIGEVPVFSGDSAHFTFPIPKRRIRLDQPMVYEEQRSPLLPILHITFLSCAVGGLIGTIYCKTVADDYHDQYMAQTTDQSKMDYYKNRRDRYNGYYRLGWVGTSIAAAASAVTITITIKTLRKKR